MGYEKLLVATSPGPVKAFMRPLAFTQTQEITGSFPG